VTFDCEKDGKAYTVQAPVGKSLLEVAHANEIELEGACEGSLACSTCHVIIEVRAGLEEGCLIESRSSSRTQPAVSCSQLQRTATSFH